MNLPQKCASALPQTGLACLKALNAPEVLAAWVAAQPKGECLADSAAKALPEAIPYEEALAQAIRLGLVQEDSGILTARRGNFAKAGPLSSAFSGRDALRAMAVTALGGPAGGARRGRDLRALALRQLYGLDELSHWPTAQQARCALLSRIVASYGGAFGDAAKRPLKAFKFDIMSRRMYLAFAGVQRGTVLQADASLLSRGLGGPADTVQALTATIIRAAIAARAPTPALIKVQPFDLESFAGSVRKLASRMETKPYAGRVAIAEVYDAGLAQGEALGSLDEFKDHLAEAAREGLLDLERYDITGPFDAGLKERSRLRLGRDERHFIVNQWI
jgi:hypothetical protein